MNMGRIGIGKVDRGTIKVGQDLVIVNAHEENKRDMVKISNLYEFDGLKEHKLMRPQLVL